MQQQQRRPLAADAGEDAACAGVDPFGRVAGKQIGEVGHVGSSAAALLLQTLFGVAAGASQVYAIPQVRSSRTTSRGNAMSIDFEIPAEAKAIREKVRKRVCAVTRRR